MKIPDKVRIGGVDYDVTYADNLRKGHDLLYGEIDFEDCEIRISNTDGHNHQFRCITLLHEILHGIAFHANLGFESLSSEETIIDTFAKGLYQVLQDNGSVLFDLSKGDTNE